VLRRFAIFRDIAKSNLEPVSVGAFLGRCRDGNNLPSGNNSVQNSLSSESRSQGDVISDLRSANLETATSLRTSTANDSIR